MEISGPSSNSFLWPHPWRTASASGPAATAARDILRQRGGGARPPTAAGAWRRAAGPGTEEGQKRALDWRGVARGRSGGPKECRGASCHCLLERNGLANLYCVASRAWLGSSNQNIVTPGRLLMPFSSSGHRRTDGTGFPSRGPSLIPVENDLRAHQLIHK